jgi:glycosyltransferase involved in cell wall biosynthesis
LRVAYVFMKFPGRHETFGGTEIRALRQHGVEVSAYSLRWRPRDAEGLLEHWGLEGLPARWVGFLDFLIGVGMLLHRPTWSAYLLGAIFKDNSRNPVHLVKSIVLAPFVLVTFAWLKRANPDVVHLFWGHYPSLLGLLVKRFTPSTPLTMFLGAYDLNTELGTSHRCARLADAVFTHAKANLRRLKGLDIAPERLHLVYRGIDLSLFEPDSGPAIPGRVVTVGYLEEEKGMRHVLEVFRRVQHAVRGSSLVVVGDGPDRSYLERQAAELQLADVRFTGHISHRGVLQELGIASVFLFLSFSEDDRLPNAVKEAIASRCVCVVSDTPGIDELVQDGSTGYVVSAADHEAAADVVCRSLGDPEGAASMTQRAYRMLESRFHVMATTGGYLGVWGSLSRPTEPGRLANDGRRSP